VYRPISLSHSGRNWENKTCHTSRKNKMKELIKLTMPNRVCACASDRTVWKHSSPAMRQIRAICPHWSLDRRRPLIDWRNLRLDNVLNCIMKPAWYLQPCTMYSSKLTSSLCVGTMIDVGPDSMSSSFDWLPAVGQSDKLENIVTPL